MAQKQPQKSHLSHILSPKITGPPPVLARGHIVEPISQFVVFDLEEKCFSLTKIQNLYDQFTYDSKDLCFRRCNSSSSCEMRSCARDDCVSSRFSSQILEDRDLERMEGGEILSYPVDLLVVVYSLLLAGYLYCLSRDQNGPVVPVDDEFVVQYSFAFPPPEPPKVVFPFVP